MTQSLEEAIIRHSMENPERMPTLEMIIDRFQMAVGPALKQWCAMLPVVAAETPVYTRFEDSLEGLPSPSYISIAQAEPWPGYICCLVEPDLLFAFLETILGGGTGKGASWSPRNFTAIERGIGRRITEIALDALAESFSAVIETSFTTTSVETSPRAIVLAQPTTPSLRLRLKLKLEDREGHMVVILPYGIFAAVRDRLAQPFHGHTLGAGANGWRSEIGRSLIDCEPRMTVTLAHIRTTLGRMMEWKHGDVIDLGITPDDVVTGRINHTPVLEGSFGRRDNGNLALRVTRRLVDSEEEVRDDRGAD